MDARETVLALPVEWRHAYERDREGSIEGSDPAPERGAGRVLSAFILSGLVFLVLPGTLLGVWNLFEISQQRASTAASLAWIQAHGQAQVFGWVSTFILGISLYVLPKFLGRPLRRFGPAWVLWALWVVGAAWRWWVGVGGLGWRVGLAASAALELAAFVLAQHLLWFSRRGRSEKGRFPGDLASWLGSVGFGAFGIALLLNLWISVELALKAPSPVYPALDDRRLIVIALWGFVIPVAWGYSSRFVTIFAGLANAVQGVARWLAAAVAGIVVLALARKFLLANALAFAATLVAVWALRVFLPSERPPKRIRVYRHYPAFVRAAFAWLVVGAALGVVADLAPGLTGLGGASRHALTVGFIATLIFCVGPLILPSFLNGRELWSPSLMGLSLWLLTLGCLLRVSTESIAYSWGGPSWRMLPVSASLELGGVVVFATNVGLTLAQPVPVWFEPETVKESLPVYFFVASYPETRALLVSAGLRTLAAVHEIPHSLTLEEAVRADRADVKEVLARLRSFVQQRQPRRRRI